MAFASFFVVRAENDQTRDLLVTGPGSITKYATLAEAKAAARAMAENTVGKRVFALKVVFAAKAAYPAPVVTADDGT